MHQERHHLQVVPLLLEALHLCKNHLSKLNHNPGLHLDLRLDLRLEQWLVRGLVTAMALGGLVVAAVYGAGWLAALDASGTSGHWLLVIGGCVALTWMPDALRQWFGRRGLA